MGFGRLLPARRRGPRVVPSLHAADTYKFPKLGQKLTAGALGGRRLRPQHRQKLLGAELRIPLDEETLRPCAQTHIVSSLAANMATAAVQNMRNIGAIVAVAGLFALPLTAETQGGHRSPAR